MIYAWNILDPLDLIKWVGSDTLQVAAMDLHNDPNSPYKLGLVGEQLVLFRSKRLGETAGSINMEAENSVQGVYNEDNYIPPTVPTDPFA